MADAAKAGTLRVERNEGVLFLTLDRPDKRNALNAALIGALDSALIDAEFDVAVRVIAIRGAGKDFSAGADLAELLESADRSPAENEAAALKLGELFLRIRRLPKPVVALVHGRALAGGAGLATACDIVLANPESQFGYPEIQRGFVPAMVLAVLRRHVGEKVAFDLAATGRLLSAAEALALGLISRVIPDADFAAASQALLAQLAALSASAMALTKRQLYEVGDLSYQEGIRLGARVNALARVHPDFRQAISAFLK